MGQRTGIVGRVLAAASAGAAGNGITIVRQVALVPLFLVHWDMTGYGEWLLLTSAATQLGALDLGVQTFVINRLTQHHARDELTAFAALYHTAERAYLGAVPLLVGLSVLLTSFIDVGALLGVEQISATDARAIFCLQVTTVAAALCFGLTSGLPRATGNLAASLWLSTAHTATVVAAQALTLALGASPLVLAAVTALPTVVFLIATIVYGRMRAGTLVRHPEGMNFQLLGEVWRGGVWYGGLVLSNVLRVQLTLVAVGRIEGAASAAMYSMIRTLAFAARQLVGIATGATQTELTRMDAREQVDRVRHLLWLLMFGALWMTSAGTAGLYVHGEDLVNFWSGGSAQYNGSLMAGWLANLVLGAAWYAAAIIPATTNRPKVLVWANGAGSAVGFGLGVLLTFKWGPMGMIIGITLAELLMSSVPVFMAAASVAKAPLAPLLVRVAVATLACLVTGPLVAWGSLPLDLAWWCGLPLISCAVGLATAPLLLLALPAATRDALLTHGRGLMRRAS